MNLPKHDHAADYTGKRWIFTGLAFSIVMYVFFLLLALISPDWSMTWKTAFTFLPICILGGLAYGGMMKLFFRARSKGAA